jgi:hypothetical protein
VLRAKSYLILCCALLLGASNLRGQQRDIKIEAITAKRSLALLIGNDAYQGAPLKNAANDARAMEKALRDVGFETTILIDASNKTMQTGVSQFAAKLSPGDVAIVYYAGHGVQVDGENYLVPVDFDGHDAADLKFQSTSASWVQEKLEQSGVQLKIMILDACRTNPFRRSRGGASGLAQMQGGRGSFVAFATAAGKVANDNVDAGNGLFTQYLVEALKEPMQSLDDVFNRVREEVDKASGGQQLPYVYSGVVGQYYFRPPKAAPVTTTPTPTLTNTPSGGDPIRITSSVIAREPTLSGLNPRLAEPETDFLTTDPRVWAMFSVTGGQKGDKIRGEWRNPFGAASAHFDIEKGVDGGSSTYYYSLAIAGSDAGKMPGNWELRIFGNDQGIAILPFRVSPPPNSQVRFLNNTVLARGTVNVPYRYQFRAGGGAPPYRWTLSGNPPPGLTVSNEGLVSGTPLRRGSFRLLVRVEDSAGNATTRALGFSVGVVPQTVHIASAGLTKAAAGPDACAVAEGTDRFSTSDPFARLVFSVDGEKPGERAGVEWLGPSGEVQFFTGFESKEEHRPCYRFRMPIAGNKAAKMPGNWTARVHWLDGEILTIPFQIVE